MSTERERGDGPSSDERGRCHRWSGLRGPYVKHFLLPTLKEGEGQVVVIDNLQAHKSARVRNLIESAGSSVLFLAPYSPDFSPIEEAFSKIKAIFLGTTIEARARRRLWWKP